MVLTPKLVLFDIDGTLVQTGRAGQRGLNAAFARLHGWESALDGVSLAGRTDRAIVGEIFESRGGETPGDTEVFRVRDAYLEALPVEIARPSPQPFGVLPGVAGLLDALEGDSGFVVALLTGNFEGGAAIKLGHFDLWRRFAFGAFGDLHVNRRDLVPIAIERARLAGHAVASASDVVVIGDTPLDVDCARVHGARALAVATGPFSTDALGAAGASVAVETLEDAGGLARWIATGA